MAETAKEKRERLAAEKLAAEQQSGSASEGSSLPAKQEAPAFDFFVDKVDEDTGEVMRVPKYKYLEGHPRQYRTDAKLGNFNIMDGKVLGEKLTFQPIAFRFFQDDIFKQGLKNWAEVFFIDENNCVAAILFHGFSAENLSRLAEPLYYQDKFLTDVVVTASLAKQVNDKIKPPATFYLAEFTFEDADPEVTKELKAFAKTQKFYRRASLQGSAVMQSQRNFYNPFDEHEQAELEAPATDAEVVQ